MLTRVGEFNPSLYKSKVTAYRVECAGMLSGDILDCGGGLGNYLPYFRGNPVVLDKAFHVLERLAHGKKVVADAERLPFADNSFDAVWACAMVQYIRLPVFIREATRVTREGGRILILVPNAKSPWDLLKKAAGMPTWSDQEGIVRQYTVDDLAAYGEVVGEIQFLPFEKLLRKVPRLGHTLMLDIKVRKS